MDQLEDENDIGLRYNRWYDLGNVKFYLEQYLPNIQECRFLLTKVIEQAINDYCNLEGSDIPNAEQLWFDARDFLFDEDYWICWGDLELNLEDICDILDLDVEWIRDSTQKKYRSKRNAKSE